MATLSYTPFNLGRWILWGAYALALAVMPQLYTAGFALTVLSQMGIGIIFALSYNMLLGQSGMLSFGHAVYSGLGAFFAIHTLNLIGKGAILFPVTLLPLVGGAAGMLVAVVFGYPSTRRSGTTFAMISLGIGELVYASSLMFPGFFGGEGGITTNRVAGAPLLGITYGPAVQVYYLIAAWVFICTGAMYAFTHTPLGRMANAARDNAERVEFIGYNTRRVRYLVMIVAGFFAGVAGSLSCLNYEIVSAENVGALRSGGVLIATFIGGAGFFIGPIIGAVVFALMVTAIGAITKAWLLYLGLLFLVMVLYAPGGFASLVLMNLQMARYGQLARLVPGYAAVLATGLVALLGLIGAVEMGYHLSLEASVNPLMNLYGLSVDVTSPSDWIACAAVIAAGLWPCRMASKRLRREWDEGQRVIQENKA
jgi:branched-chain amino acid transport system permease protein